MCSSTPCRVPILVLNGMMCILYFVLSCLAGRRVPLSIITWVCSLLVRRILLVFLCHSTPMIAIGQFFHSPAYTSLVPSKVLAEAAAYIMCYLLIEAGYLIGIAKSQWVASTIVRFHGFLCDSSCQAFLLPDDKKLKFSSLREQMLASRNVGLKML